MGAIFYYVLFRRNYVQKRDKAGKRMQVVDIDIKELTPYEKNPRKNDDAVQYVAESIKQFGFKVPIVIDKNNVIVAGHTRYKAAKKLKLKTVPCLVADDLTDEQIKAFRLADNKVAEFSEWDFDLLELELKALEDFDLDFNLADFGFDDIFEEEEYISAEEIEEDNIEDIEVPQEPKSKTGDIYQLGNHRLMCGDSTNINDVEKLMNGKRADMVFTDPPYNIGYQGVKDKRSIINDKMSDKEFVDFLKKGLMKCDTAYVCCSWQYEHLFKQAMNDLDMPPKAMIIWDKVNPAQHLDKYFKQYEIILYYGKFGGEKTIRGDIWQCKRERNTIHPTMKPLKLIGMALSDNPDKKIVYDGFGGSGSTLIACEKLNRRCFMMEMDPKYVDVIIARWEEYTGKKAVLLNK